MALPISALVRKQRNHCNQRDDQHSVFKPTASRCRMPLLIMAQIFARHKIYTCKYRDFCAYSAWILSGCRVCWASATAFRGSLHWTADGCSGNRSLRCEQKTFYAIQRLVWVNFGPIKCKALGKLSKDTVKERAFLVSLYAALTKRKM